MAMTGPWPLLLLVIGAALGLLSSLAVSSLGQRQAVILRLLDQYLEVRKEIVDTVSDLTTPDRNEALPEEVRLKYRDSVAKLFYKHFDFLPHQVLDALLLLHTALANPDGRLFKVHNFTILPLDESEIPSFVSACSMYKNGELIVSLALKSSNPVVRSNLGISLHARYVLYTLNKFASLDEMMSITSKFRKAASKKTA